MKRGNTCVLFILMMVLLFPSFQSVAASEQLYYYIDGQEQRYQGEIVEDTDGLWVPIRPILSHLLYINQDWELDTLTINQYLRDEREEDSELVEKIEFLNDLEVKQMNNRDMLHIEDVQRLGFDAYHFKADQIVQINTPGIMEIAGLKIGDHREKVSQLYSDVHWNTGFGQDADVIGFAGDKLTYSYVDRYGYERESEVPELQVEIKSDQITYLLVSSERFPTSKKIKVGDRLGDVYRSYGNQHVRQRVDDKQVIVYDVEFGSIWFIANSKQVVERIAYWDQHLRGFGENKIDEIEVTSAGKE